MQRYLSVIVLVALYMGCSAMQCSALPPLPDQKVLRSLQTIAVIPLAGRGPTYSSTFGAYINPRDVAAGVVLLPLLLPVLATISAAKTAAIPEGALILEREPQGDSGRLSVALAMGAAEALHKQGARTVSLVDGYLRLPVSETGKSPADIQFEVQTRLGRWYNEDVARVDYSGISTEGIDAILEVGVPGHQYRFACVSKCSAADLPNDLLIVQVQVRVVNPATKAVLGRATHQVKHKVTYGEVVPRGFLGGKGVPSVPGQQLDNLVNEMGREALLECLKDLGLLAP